MQQRTMANDRSIYDRTSNLIDEKKNSRDLINTKILEQKNESKESSSAIKTLEKNQIVLDKKLTIEKKKYEQAELELLKLSERQQHLINYHSSLSVKKDALKDQADFYKELIESNEGFPEGTQYVLENSKSFPGVLGTIADVFQVEEKYRDALETGLGDLSHCIISKDKKTALQTLDKAVAKNAGDLTIIPLKEAVNYKTQLKKVPKNQNIIARASDIIKTDKKLNALAEYILGDLSIVKDLNKATSDMGLNGWTLVDLNGSYAGSDLIIKSRQVSEHGNLIGRKKRLEIIAEELEKIQKEEQKTVNDQTQIEQELKIFKSSIDKDYSSIQKTQGELNQLDSDLMRNHLSQSQILENISMLKQDLIETERIIENSKASLQKLKPAIEKQGEKTTHKRQWRASKG